MARACGTLIINADALLHIQLKDVQFAIYRAICDILEGDDRVTEAIGYFREMQNELAKAMDVCNEGVQWELGEWLPLNTSWACLSIRCRFSTEMRKTVSKARRRCFGFSEL